MTSSRRTIGTEAIFGRCFSVLARNNRRFQQTVLPERIVPHHHRPSLRTAYPKLHKFPAKKFAAVSVAREGCTMKEFRVHMGNRALSNIAGMTVSRALRGIVKRLRH